MDGEKPRQPIRVSREELFDQVWATPMSRLASSYGISGNGLAKACNRMKVPYPPRGWWAKKAAGKKVSYSQLRPAPAGVPTSTLITPTPERAPEVEAARDRIEKDVATVGAIQVSELLRRPHAIIAGWIAEKDRRLAEAKRDRNPWSTSIIENLKWTESDHRRHRILDALFKAVERRGAIVKEKDRILYFEVSGERIDYKLREKQRQIRRPKTKEEMRWSISPDRNWAQELQPTGNLSFSIETYLPALPKRSWIESDHWKMDNHLGEIVAAIVAAGPLLVEQRKRREMEEQRRQEEEARRRQEEERRRLDAYQWRRFVEIAEQWQQADVVRRFVSAIENNAGDDGTPVGGRTAEEWLSWAREWLNKHDPMAEGVDRILKDLASVTSWTYRS